ncbi:MAG: ECF-type sigma factor [Acidobacteriota bacterium]|nr:ECF-type sigma factor [Acidobacteriota bacterium]
MRSCKHRDHYTFGLHGILTAPGDVTTLLRRWGEGDSSASEPLFELVYPQLKKIAGALFRDQQPAILQPTVLVNELYLKLLQQRRLCFEDRRHFFSLAARLMRRVLVDQARHEGRQKRSGGTAVPLHEDLAWVMPSGPEMLDLNRQLDELEQIDARKSRMVELRYFLGLTAEETAEVMESSKATVDRDLRFACVWLYERLHSPQE